MKYLWKKIREEQKKSIESQIESLDKVVRNLKGITKKLCHIYQFKIKINQKELEERVIMLGKDSNENNHNNIQISKI